MLNKILDKWTKWTHEGMNFPYAKDVSTGKPSVTLLAFYVLFVMTTMSLIALHFNTNLWLATGYTIFAWIVSFVYYKLRRLDNVKLNIREGKVELDSDEETENE